jgi:hypothetical protein
VLDPDLRVIAAAAFQDTLGCPVTSQISRLLCFGILFCSLERALYKFEGVSMWSVPSGFDVGYGTPVYARASCQLNLRPSQPLACSPYV